MNTTYTAHAVSDLFNAGFACDGHPFMAECFYVLVENAAGRRFRHEAVFRGAEAVTCDETGDTCFSDLREEASAKAERLAARVNEALASGAVLDSSRWFEVDPAYGSDEYQSQGVEAQRAFADRNS